MSDGAEALPPRLYGTEAAIRRIAAGLLDRTLPRADWTHEAHLAAVSVLLLEHREIDLPRELPAIIAAYNEAVGGRNSDTEGYHETITQYWIAAARAFHAANPAGSLVERVNRFITSPEGRRDAPLRHFSRDRLFSVEAQRLLVEPDRMRFEWTNAAPAVID
ncbi:MAG: hypothetical protein ACK4Z0_01015 [Sphingomonadaceae bacterium]